jgi:hypothetical protein
MKMAEVRRWLGNFTGQESVKDVNCRNQKFKRGYGKEMNC